MLNIPTASSSSPNEQLEKGIESRSHHYFRVQSPTVDLNHSTQATPKARIMYCALPNL